MEKWKPEAGERPCKGNMRVLPTLVRDNCLDKCSGISHGLTIVQLSDRGIATEVYVDFKLTQFFLAKGSLHFSLTTMLTIKQIKYHNPACTVKA